MPASTTTTSVTIEPPHDTTASVVLSPYIPNSPISTMIVATKKKLEEVLQHKNMTIITFMIPPEVITTTNTTTCHHAYMISTPVVLALPHEHKWLYFLF